MTPKKLTATYRITTPMFCSGADQQEAELRLSSLKGALRFWWRTLHGHLAVKDLREKEGKLFGSTKHGQSNVKIQMTKRYLQATQHKGYVFEQGKLHGTHYLGYGVIEAFASQNKGTKAGELKRPMIPGGTFTVAVLPHPKLKQEELDDVRKALILLGTVGGLGSKARKGFGSLTLTALEGEAAGSLPDDVESRLRECLPASLPVGTPEPEWTAWSSASRVVTVTMGASEAESAARAVDLLDRFGREQVHYRSWGQNGKVLGHDSEQNFKEDHDLSKGMRVAIKHPKRVVFGLPHNYGKGDQNEVKPAARELDRRASPLFLHVHQSQDDGRPTGVVAFLPARFLQDDNGNICAFGSNVSLDTNHLWQPIHGYLDRLIGKTGATERKTKVIGEEMSVG